MNVPGSELDAVSDAAGDSPIHVGEDVFFVVGKGLRLAEISGGLFDPTVGPLMQAWKMNTEEGKAPAAGRSGPGPSAGELAGRGDG